MGHLGHLLIPSGRVGAASPHLVQLAHWLALLWPPFEMLVSWHPAFLENCSDEPCTWCRGRAFERSKFATASRLQRTVASSARPQATVPPPRDATVSGVQRGALKRSAGVVGERKSALSVRCVHCGVLGRSECRWHRQGGAVAVDGRPPGPSWRPSSSCDGRPFRFVRRRYAGGYGGPTNCFGGCGTPTRVASLVAACPWVSGAPAAALY